MIMNDEQISKLKGMNFESSYVGHWENGKGTLAGKR
jgi:hypothetical protein